MRSHLGYFPIKISTTRLLLQVEEIVLIEAESTDIATLPPSDDCPLYALNQFIVNSEEADCELFNKNARILSCR